MSKTLSTAIQACSSAQDRGASSRAHEQLLDAVGNNHAGTYDRSVLPLINELKEVLHTGSVWAQITAVETLIDLYGSFEPECSEPDSGKLLAEVGVRVVGLEQNLILIAQSGSMAAAHAQELLDLIVEQRPNNSSKPMPLRGTA